MGYRDIRTDGEGFKKLEADLYVIPVTVGFKNIKKSKNPSFQQKVISWWTNSDYTHTEIRIGDIWIASKENEGVSIKDYDKNFKAEGWDYVDIRDIVLPANSFKLIEKWVNDVNGSKYDWLSILLCHFANIRLDHASKWTCSELVSKVLQLLHHRDFIDIRPEAMAPGDVAKLLMK